jgi:hypothetical protein
MVKVKLCVLFDGEIDGKMVSLAFDTTLPAIPIIGEHSNIHIPDPLGHDDIITSVGRIRMNPGCDTVNISLFDFWGEWGTLDVESFHYGDGDELREAVAAFEAAGWVRE